MPRPPTYQKANPAEQPVLYLSLDSSTLPLYRVTDFANNVLANRISMVGGVSRVQVYGEQKYAVRVQVDPDRLAAHNIGLDEVRTPSPRAIRISPPGAWMASTRRSPSNPTVRCLTPPRFGRLSWRGATERRSAWNSWAT